VRKTHNPALEKRLNRIAIAVSAVVVLAVGAMRQIHFDVPIDFSFLPAFHSTVNAICGITLLIALYFVKTGNLKAHQYSIYVAMGLSAVFLLSYITYHTTSSPVEFCKEGTIRTVYFVLLITHVVLAAIILPLILFTFNRAFSGDFARHKKMARWVFPLWLFVAFSGPACFLMLRPCFPA